MTGLLQDLRYALRQLRRNPGFAAVAVLTLALGIGANTAIFSLLDQALLRSLPVKDVDRLVILKYEGSNTGHLSSRADGKFYFSYPMYRDLRDRNSVFTGLLATDWTQVGVQWHNQPDSLTAERTVALLASSFGVLAVFMAAVGLYGVLAYSTAQRTPEIGLRIALGASRSSVVRMVLIEVLWLTGVSVALALPASLLLAHVIRNQLFGISSSDPLTLCLGVSLIAAVALASALVPARRAAKVDPMVALRYE